MNLIKSMGKLLLNVVTPFVFFVVGCITISFFISILGALSGYNTYVECFKGSILSPALVLVMFIITLAATFIYHSEDIK